MEPLTGKLTGVYVGRQKGEGKIAVESAELIADRGLEGDIHAGRDPRRQITLFASETLSEIQNKGFRISAEALSANLFTENLDLNRLEPGVHLHIGETIIEIVEARRPCRSITKIDNRLPKLLYGQCGQFGRILRGGVVRVGDRIEALPVGA
jgi:MOSC domain-containing protein YiiM